MTAVRQVRVVRIAVLLVVAGLLGIAVGGLLFGRPSDAEARGLKTNREWARAGAGVRAPSAGLSIVVDPVIRPLRSRRFRGRESGEYHAFRHRCSSCHVTPDPSMYGPGEWRGVVRRMGDWMKAAGVMPMPAADSAAINAFLESEAARRE